MATDREKTYAFSIFVFNPKSGELLKNGKRLSIPNQTARLLAILIENRGAVVTRQELRSQLWVNCEFGDYDQSLNRIVSELRSILRERSSKAAQYIDTLPKRGYRFVATVIETSTEMATTSVLQEVDRASETSATGSSFSPSVVSSRQILAAASGASLAYPLELTDSAVTSRRLRSRFNRRWILLAIALIVCAASVPFITNRQHADFHPLSMGIVPFEVEGDGAAQLAESFRVDLADSLSQIPKVQVQATHSLDNMGQDEAKIQARANQLGIDDLLFGHFALVGGECRLRFELVRSRDGAHLLSLEYRGSEEQLASIRDRIEADLFQHLHPSAQSVTLSLQRPSSSSAYAAYLKGRFNLANGTEQSLRLARSSFEDAIREEPNYARAYAGASSSSYILSQRLMDQRNRYVEEARAFATKAVAIDPSLAEAHAILGEIALTQDWDFDRAEEQLRRAVELDPARAANHQWLSRLYCVRAQYDKAFSEIDKAEAQDPDWNSLYITDAFISLAARRYDRADRANDLLIQRMPEWPQAYEQKGIILFQSKRYSAAIEAWHHAAMLDKNPDRARLEEEGADAFRKGGIVSYARLRLQAIRTHTGMNSHNSETFDPEEWHAYAEDWDQAVAGLQETVNQHSSEALQITTDRAFDPLHRDPRFIGLVRRVGLPLPEDSRTEDRVPSRR